MKRLLYLLPFILIIGCGTDANDSQNLGNWEQISSSGQTTTYRLSESNTIFDVQLKTFSGSGFQINVFPNGSVTDVDFFVQNSEDSNQEPINRNDNVVFRRYDPGKICNSINAGSDVLVTIYKNVGSSKNIFVHINIDKIDTILSNDNACN